MFLLPSLLSPHSSLPSNVAEGEIGASGTPVELPTAFLSGFRLGSDTTAAVASNLGASAIDRGNATVASVCIAIAATFTALKTSADYYLNAEEIQKAENALHTLIRQHGDLRKALQAVASGQAQTEILSELPAQEFLGLIDRDPDDPAELATQQNEILFQIAQWLEKWQASHQQEAELLSAQMAKRFDEQAAALDRIVSAADTANQINLTAHSVTQVKLNLLPDVLIGRILKAGQREITEKALSDYLSWVKSTTETFVVPGLGVAIPIKSAWAELKAVKSVARNDEEIGTLATEVARYHEWERLSSSRNDKSVEAEHLTFLSKLIVIVAGPGAGKSTLLRRLAYRFADTGKIVIRVRLSLVAQRMQNPTVPAGRLTDLRLPRWVARSCTTQSCN